MNTQEVHVTKSTQVHRILEKDLTNFHWRRCLLFLQVFGGKKGFCAFHNHNSYACSALSWRGILKLTCTNLVTSLDFALVWDIQSHYSFLLKYTLQANLTSHLWKHESISLCCVWGCLNSWSSVHLDKGQINLYSLIGLSLFLWRFLSLWNVYSVEDHSTITYFLWASAFFSFKIVSS